MTDRKVKDCFISSEISDTLKMPFESGNKLGGRTRGSSNKSTEVIKRSVSMILENNIDTVQSDLDLMQPRDRVNALLQFMKFVVPTQKAIELDNRESQEEKNEAYIQKLMEIPEENFNKHHEGD